MPQELNFEGGPWKLRNDFIVQKLVPTKEGYTSDDYPHFWDINGDSKKGPGYDIVESLHNWKYMREKGLD